jgi:hypothetical protein
LLYSQTKNFFVGVIVNDKVVMTTMTTMMMMMMMRRQRCQIDRKEEVG